MLRFAAAGFLTVVTAFAVALDVPPVDISPVKEATIEEVTEVPIVGSLDIYVSSQSPILAEAFCVSESDQLVVFQLSASAFVAGENVGGVGGPGEFSWTTLYASPYDFTQLPSTHCHREYLEAQRASAALLIGELKGSCGVSPCLALAFDVNDFSGRRMHYLIPLAQATPEVYAEAVYDATHPRVPATRQWIANPCGGDPTGSGTYCNDTYRRRKQNGIDAFAQCMKDSVTPISLWNVGCFVGCVPLLAGTPIAYAICVAACEGILIVGELIDYSVCQSLLEAADENARLSHCSCLAYQRQHCPDWEEPDTVGCP